MSNYMGFATDKLDAFVLMLDDSGSMEDDEANMRSGLAEFKESFENFPEVNSISVSICRFASNFRPGEFRHVKDLDLSYSTGGGTALYYSICCGAARLRDYIKEVIEAKGIVPSGTFIVFSDGEPCGDYKTEDDAKRAIQELNCAGITTVFIAFGESMRSEFGKRLGFTAVIDVKEKGRLTQFMGRDLSKSFKEQSKRINPLGANFFSQAVGNTESERFSQVTAQAFEDNSWMLDI